MWIGQYILDDDGNPEPEHDTLKWAEWFENSLNRIVQQDQIGDVFVSTVFLGLDHNYSRQGPPVLWETMTFSGAFEFAGRKHKQSADMWRYTSRKDALRGHKRVVKWVKAKQKDLQELERMATAGDWKKR
jgi:hypothetical protein